jgi:hypothetical protein
MDSDAIALIASLASAASAAFAGWQILLSRADGRRRMAFEEIRSIEERLASVLQVNGSEVQREVIDYFENDFRTLSEGGREYLKLLNCLERLSIARLDNIVDDRIVDRYVATLFASHIISDATIIALRRATKDARVFEHLSRYMQLVGPSSAVGRAARTD